MVLDCGCTFDTIAYECSCGYVMCGPDADGVVSDHARAHVKVCKHRFLIDGVGAVNATRVVPKVS